jgi:hypothetical protein
MTFARICDIHRRELGKISHMALIEGCWFLAVDEPQISRFIVLNLIVSHIRTTIPSFDTSVVKLDSLGGTPDGRKRRPWRPA